jgi:presenilin-like A22 family membrane protease
MKIKILGSFDILVGVLGFIWLVIKLDRNWLFSLFMTGAAHPIAFSASIILGIMGIKRKSLRLSLIGLLFAIVSILLYRFIG